MLYTMTHIAFMFTLNLTVVELGILEIKTNIVYFMIITFSVVVYISSLHVDLRET
jgi:hypothetical protein